MRLTFFPVCCPATCDLHVSEQTAEWNNKSFFFLFFSSRCFFLRSNSLCDKLCADAAWCKRLVPCICFRKGGSSFTVWLKKGLLNRQTNQTGSCQATAERQREGGEGRRGWNFTADYWISYRVWPPTPPSLCPLYLYASSPPLGHTQALEWNNAASFHAG